MEGIDFYMICMTKNPERMATANEVRAVIPELVVCEAVDALTIPNERLHHLKNQNFFVSRNGCLVDSFGRRYRKGALGIFLSHRSLYKSIAQNPDRKTYAVIFEDDITLDPSFNANLQKTITIIKQNNLSFDIMTLHTMNYQKEKFKNHDAEVCILQNYPGFCGLQCYIVQTSNIQNIINALDRFYDPIDEQLSRHAKVKSMHMVGMTFVHEKRLPSTISSSELLPFYEDFDNAKRAKRLLKHPQHPHTLTSQQHNALKDMLASNTCDSSVFLHVYNPFKNDIISICSELGVKATHISVGYTQDAIPFSTALATLKDRKIKCECVFFMLPGISDISNWVDLVIPNGLMFGDSANREAAVNYTQDTDILLMAQYDLWCFRTPILSSQYINDLCYSNSNL
jgi:GR25 family glycosyltransferase involved in LPS biosynthesis